jgi:hypothetical protein
MGFQLSTPAHHQLPVPGSKQATSHGLVVKHPQTTKEKDTKNQNIKQ